MVGGRIAKATTSVVPVGNATEKHMAMPMRT